MTPTDTMDRVRAGAQRVTEQTRPWIIVAAKVGLFAKGVVYLVVGALALRVALGLGGRATDGTGAMHEILRQPYGRLMVGVMAIGLLGYVFWRAVQAVLDPERRGHGAKGAGKRLASAGSALTHASLAFTALKLMSGSRAGSQDASHDLTVRVLAESWGPWIVGIAGLAVIGAGIHNVVRGLKEKFLDHLDLSRLGSQGRAWVARAGKLGHVARGIVFAVVGTFLVNAARRHDPSEVRGLGGALRELAHQPYGKWLLTSVAVGLIAYGLYMFIESRFRRVGGRA